MDGVGALIQVLQVKFHFVRRSQYRVTSDIHSSSLTPRLYLIYARCGKLECNKVNTLDVIVYYWSPEPDFFVPREKCSGSTYLFYWSTLNIPKAQVMCHWGLCPILWPSKVSSKKLHCYAPRTFWCSWHWHFDSGGASPEPFWGNRVLGKRSNAFVRYLR